MSEKSPFVTIYDWLIARRDFQPLNSFYKKFLYIQQLMMIYFTNPANFDWCLRKLLEALNIDLRDRFAPKDKLPDGRVEDFRVEGFRAHKSSGETFVDVVAKLY